jgi:hypothetical protein
MVRNTKAVKGKAVNKKDSKPKKKAAVVESSDEDDEADSDDEMDEDDLWLQEQKKILNIKTNYKREPLEYINLHFCYVDEDNEIVNLTKEKHTFS